MVLRYSLQLIGYDFTNYNVRIAKNLQEGGVYDYSFRIGDESFQGRHPAVCLDLPDTAKFEVNVDGLDKDTGCVLADRWDTTWHEAEVRVWGRSIDDNRVGPDVYTHTIRLQPSSDYTIVDDSHNIDMRVAEDDASSIRLGPEAGTVGLRVWRTIEGMWSLYYDIRGAGWHESGTSITTTYTKQRWESELAKTVDESALQRGFTSMKSFDRSLGGHHLPRRLDCSLGSAEMKLTGVWRNELLSNRTPGTAGYVAVHPAGEWVSVCKPPPAGPAKATATLTAEKHYQCYGQNIRMGEQWIDLEWNTAGADANGIEVGVSKDLGLGNGVYRSSATRINLAAGNLTAAALRDLVNSKTTFQNDGRANPIRVTAVGPETPASKMVDGECEHKDTFLGFEVSLSRATFSGGR